MSMRESRESSARQTARNVIRGITRHENFALGIILAVIAIVLAVITGGRSIAPGNVRNVIVQSSTRGIASIGQAFAILGGNFDLSVGGIALLATVLSASMMTNLPEYNILGSPVPMAVAIPIMLLAGLGVGTLNGLSVSRIKMPPLIVTLAMWQMTKGIAYQICKGYTIIELPQSLAFGQSYLAGVPVPVIFFVAVVAIGYFVLHYTTFGRSVYASGGNPVSAWLSGVKVHNVTLYTYMISGFLAALAGLITMSRTMCGTMMSMSGLELDTIAAVCIGGVSLMGGRGTLTGVVIGVLIIGTINNGMTVIGLNPAFQDLVRGGVIFAAVAVDYTRRSRAA
jgi:ribose/xylose/arabinose/galactoside ABC-type transport system permease subunit